VRRLVSPGGKLNAPWGVALASANFGSYSNLLLIGNFGDGAINAFDPNTGVFAGTISDSAGTALKNAGLWGIAFGNGSQNQPVDTLYLTAGISGETAGLYARIDVGATAPDAVAPTVSLTAPAAGTISGTVGLAATAADDVGVAKVNFIVRVGTTNTTVNTDTTAPYAFDLDTTKLVNGAASLIAQAVDAAGNATSSTAVAVTIDNVAAPAVSLATLQANLFGPVCSGCHSGVGAALPGSMNLTSQASTAAALINVTSLEVPSLKRVLPGDPANSYVVHKISGTQTVGGRMPLGGAALSQQQIDDVKAWIQAGAAP
jgi:mono/diheme cytochrome c family protein